MEKNVLLYHYAERLKAVFIIASHLLDSYERARDREEIIHALFDALDGEVNIAMVVLGKTGAHNQRYVEEAQHALHSALSYFNTGETAKSREKLAEAISSVVTIADRSLRELES